MKEREEITPRVFVIVDVETTGTRPLHDRVIDVAAIRVEDGVVTHTINTLINPGVPLFHGAPLSGITNEMLVTAPSFEDVALQLQELFQGAVFVAHNAHFDYGFIKNEFRRIGLSFHMPMLCTVKLSRALFPQERGHDLDSLMIRHGIACDDRHRAYPDAFVVHQWLRMLPHLIGTDVFSEHVDRLLEADTLPPLLHRNVLKGLPDTPGIYFFYGKDRELLYVGKSKNIRTRVRSHFSNMTSRTELRLCSQTAFVETTETPGELSALLLEAQTIKTHMPLYNRALRRARTMVVALQETDEYGYYRLRLEQRTTLPEGAVVAGLFRTMVQAKAALRLIAKEQRLCPKLLNIESCANSCFNAQLGLCDGACMQKESSETYNKKFTEAFRNRAIKSWPYKGPIMIEEKGNTEGTGTVFFVRNWQLVKSISYDLGGVEDFIPAAAFDYDTYKILARYIFDSKHKRSIKEISERDLKRTLQTISQNYEPVVEYLS
jgi:DNA polymerase III subunit epsilon